MIVPQSQANLLAAFGANQVPGGATYPDAWAEFIRTMHFRFVQVYSSLASITRMQASNTLIVPHAQVAVHFAAWNSYEVRFAAGCQATLGAVTDIGGIDDAVLVLPVTLVWDRLLTSVEGVVVYPHLDATDMLNAVITPGGMTFQVREAKTVNLAFYA